MLPGIDDGPRAMAYGDQELSGKLQFAHYRQTQDEMWLVIELCAGECDALYAHPKYSDGRSMPATGAVWQYWWYPGTAAGAVDPNLKAVLPSWNESFGAPPGSDTGTCYVVVKLMQFSRFWKSSIPSMLWPQRCRKPLSPATGLYTYSTSYWDQWYDFARWSEGKALPASRVEAASFVAAKAADVAAGRKHESHLLLLDDAKPDDVIETFRLMARAHWFWDADRYRVVADRPGASIITLDDDAVSRSSAGDLDCIYDALDRANKITIEYTDVANGRQLTSYSFPEVDPIGEIVEEEQSLPHIHDRGQIKEIAAWLYYSRVYDVRLREPWMGWCEDLKLGDIVTRFVEQRGLVIPFRYVARTVDSNRSFVAELHEYNENKFITSTLTDAPKLESTLPDPDAVPPDVTLESIGFSEELYEEQSNAWKTRGVLSFTLPSFAFIDDAVEIYVSINGGTQRHWFTARQSPAYTPALSETGSYAITLRTRNRRTRELSEGTTKTVAVTGSTDAPQEAVGVVLDTASLDGNLTAATMHWGAPEVIVNELFPAGDWSNYSGLTSFTAANVNDGSVTSVAFVTGSSSKLRFYRTAGRRFTQLTVTHDESLGVLVTARHSGDGMSWALATRDYAPEIVDLGGGKYRQVFRWLDPGAARAHWEFEFAAAGDTVFEVQPGVRGGEFTQVREFRLYGYAAGVWKLVCPPIPRAARPTAEKPLDVFPFDIVSEYTRWDGGGGGYTRFKLTTVNAAGVESAGIIEQTASIWLPTGSAVAPSIPQQAAQNVTLSSANGANVGIVLASGPGPVVFTVNSGLGATLHGVLAMSGAVFPFINRTGGTLLFKNESATEPTLGNRIVPQGAADLAISSGEGGWIIYDSHGGTNRWRVFAVASSASLAAYAPLESPAFTGTPAAPTPATSDDSTRLATTAFVKALGYAPLTSPTFSGAVGVPTVATSTNSTNAASTAFVRAAIAAYSPVLSVAGRGGDVVLAVSDVSGAAPLASPAFTGTPTTPTAATATNNTQAASTAFVRAAIAAYSPVLSVAGQTGAVTNIPWSAITGTPTTRAGYGITDAAPIASPAFTGTPTGPTAAVGTNTTQLATCAFVLANQAAVPSYQDVAYNAGNFTPLGGTSPTWTVGSSDQVDFFYSYSSAANKLEVVVTLDNTSITGAPTELRIAIPGGYSPASGTEVLGSYTPGSSATEAVRVFVTAGTGYIRIQRLGGSGFVTGTNNQDFALRIVIRTA